MKISFEDFKETAMFLSKNINYINKDEVSTTLFHTRNNEILYRGTANLVKFSDALGVRFHSDQCPAYPVLLAYRINNKEFIVNCNGDPITIINGICSKELKLIYDTLEKYPGALERFFMKLQQLIIDSI